MRETVL